MKQSPKNYALAFTQALESGARKKEEVIKNFARLIRKNGDLKLFPKIEEETKKLLIKKAGGRHVKVEFARMVPDAETKKITSQFSPKDWVETSINPSLVAGVRITLNGEEELDNSLSRKLNKLFK